MAEQRDVYINEDGEYRTYPDGDFATQDEIISYIDTFSPEFRKLLGERTVLIHGVGGRGNVYRQF